jgi:hypothetical protein
MAMNSLKKILAVFLLSAFASSALGSTRAELDLWKYDPFLYGKCGHCGDFYKFKPNKDRSKFTDFSLYLQTGYYSAVLHGPAGTMVTLFGRQNFKTQRGYLIIVKKDNSVVQVPDLEAFAPGRWIDEEAKEGTSGAFSVFYSPYQYFKNNVGSVKWGKWWTKLPPG